MVSALEVQNPQQEMSLKQELTRHQDAPCKSDQIFDISPWSYITFPAESEQIIKKALKSTLNQDLQYLPIIAIIFKGNNFKHKSRHKQKKMRYPQTEAWYQ